MTASDQRLRIAFVYDALYPYRTGGAERRYHELARRLADRHEIHHISWRYWQGGGRISREGVTYHGLGRPPSFYGSDGKRTVGEAVAFAARLLPALLRRSYDVIDCSATPYLPLYSCWLASRVNGTPLVATWHEFWGDHWQLYLAHRPVLSRVARLAEAWARPLADHRVAVSPFTARRMLAGAEPDASLSVVGNGVDLDGIGRAVQAGEASDVVFVGRLIDDKNVDLLLQALKLLDRQGIRLRCVIIGEGPERPALEALARALEIDDTVRFTGRLEESRMYGLMKASRVLAFPSIREGFGISVVEAQACGLVPLVVRSELSAAQSLVTDQVDGWVCEPTAISLASALTALLSDGARLRRMGQAARAAAGRWDWDARATEMEEVYMRAVLGRLPAATSREPRAALKC